MSPPSWWNQRRYGLFVHANIATVPAFAPIGEYAEWYWSHLGTDPLEDVLLHPTPMVEVLAHHRDRWGFIQRYDDFLPLLTFGHFDADGIAGLAVEGGMGYLVMTAKHHDGFCWWDAPATDRTSVRHGPGRDVIDELAGATDRAGLVFGTSYSLLDWADPGYPDPATYVEAVLHPHVMDLVERYGSRVLWGDGHWGHGRDHWRSAELIDRARRAAARNGLDLVVNDRWCVSDPDIATHEYEAPAGIVAEPWELCRGVGWSFGRNRAERAEHHLSARGLLDVLTETVAKGGNLLLGVGPGADGTVPELQTRPIRAVGEWLAAHPDIIDGTDPFASWGDDDVRYTVTTTGATAGRVNAIDLGGDGRFAALHTGAHRIRSVRADDGAAISWTQDRDGLHVTRADRAPPELAAVYHVELEPIGGPVPLFGSEPSPATPLAPLLATARSGDVVSLGEGRYAGPAAVPAGVTLQGAGGGRTVVAGGGATAVTLAESARLADVEVVDGPPRIFFLPAPTVLVVGDGATIARVVSDGHVRVEAADAVVDACTLPGIVGTGADGLTVRDSTLRGMRWDTGIDLDGGTGHRLEGNDVAHHLCAIRIRRAAGVTVRRNHLRGRWWGVHLADCQNAAVTANLIERTMRAVDVEGGASVEIAANVVTGGDSGCIVEAGAVDVSVLDNRWERCRIGLLVWDSPGTRIGPNGAVQLDGDALVTGPDPT